MSAQSGHRLVHRACLLLTQSGHRRPFNGQRRLWYYGPVGLGLLIEELTRCSFLNYFAQPHKLIYALI
jgi:hypothetical protein